MCVSVCRGSAAGRGGGANQTGVGMRCVVAHDLTNKPAKVVIV